MTQTVPATAVLGPGATGLTIGLRVLNLDGTTYAAFSTTGVAETSTAGTYRKAGGVVCPLAGGYIVWGTALVDYAEATVESASANVTFWKDATAPAMTGDAFARLGAPAGLSVSADVAAVKAQTAAIETDTQDLQTQVGTDGAGLTALGDTRIANLDAAVSTRSTYAGGAVASVTGAVGSVTAPVTAGTVSDKTGYALTSAYDAAKTAATQVSVDGIKAKTDLISASGEVSVTSAISGSTITILRGDSLSASIATLGDISSRSKLWFTVKTDTEDADTAALVQIEETAGLVRLNGAAGTALLGDITVTDANAGNITITLDETATDDLMPRRNMSYDVQMLTSTGTVTTLTSGTLHVTADVTRAVA